MYIWLADFLLIQVSYPIYNFRLYALIASHKQEFSKVAVYMTANYVTEVQRVTLHPVVKVTAWWLVFVITFSTNVKVIVAII